VILAGLLISWGIVIAPTAGAAPAQTCPPTCDQIPSAAWPAPWSIPLNATYHWPDLATVAVPAPGARFRFEELCAGPRPIGDPRDYAVTAKALVTAPEGQWQLQAQIVHWRGETWRGGQLATQVFDAAVAALRACQLTAPQYSPSVTTAMPNQMAAVISGPHIVHQYLVVNPANSTVSELALWAAPGAGSGPAVPWPVIADLKVLDAMAAPLCGAYLGSCG
jgi:hypothetical protein